VVEFFNKGGPFMWPLLVVLLVGVVFTILKFWALSRSTINTRKFLVRVKSALSEGGVDEAVRICERTRGPISAIFHAGLLRANKGVEHVEKAIENAAIIETGFLERGMIWLAWTINIAPMLGFLGTVSGMIGAFEAIARANDISPSIVASGISEALITTASGLVIAVLIQSPYNYFVQRIDGLIMDMEESSAMLIETLAEAS
jgi:biopolymer transport protein ExbB